MADIFRGEKAYEDTPYTIMGRFCSRTASGSASPVTSEGNLITQSDVSSVAVKAYDSAGDLITSTTPSKADVCYDTIQTSGVWGRLVRGGNFLYDCPATMFPTGSDIVRIEVTLTLTNGDLVRALWDVPVIGLNQS